MLTQPHKGNVYRIDKLVNRMDFNRQLSVVVSIASPLERDSLIIIVSNTGLAFTHRRNTRRPSP